ncbi:alpha/beta hydrolase [Brevundimonas diminuta]|uniref:alpha/beta fold hydrolase n=1 Tax=Brevundimonas diminuta TaxID=293 RepID=UPI00320B2274
MSQSSITYRTVPIDGVNVFYRERGPVDGPAVLLLHGFPSASHQFQRLIESFPGHFRVVAPDYPGFGRSDAPESRSGGGTFTYTFDQLSDVMERFCQAVGLTRFVMYVFDYGAPVGFRLAQRQTEWISGLVIQNANAYEEGLGEMARELIALRPDRPGDEDKILGVLAPEAVRAQYLTGVSDPPRMAPEAWVLDSAYLGLPGRKQGQVELAFDYASNIALYPAWQAWLRRHRPPTLIVWGRNDPFFTQAGALAYQRDLPEAEVHLFPTGHFALEEKLHRIAPLVIAFTEEVTARERDRIVLAAPSGAQVGDKTQPHSAPIASAAGS